jgi:hypothetical protein
LLLTAAGSNVVLSHVVAAAADSEAAEVFSSAASTSVAMVPATFVKRRS